MSTSDFIFEKNKIRFVFDAGNKGPIYTSAFKNPSCLEQYNAFHTVSKNHEKLYDDAKNYLTSNLDFELFLNLLHAKKDKKEELMGIFLNFPYFKIKYDTNKFLPTIDFEGVIHNQFYKKLILIYSIIQDSAVLLYDFKENDIIDFIIYNEAQKDSPLIIKKNIFEFFISKLNKDYSLKQTCKSVFSIPTLFDYLLALKPDLFHKIKKLKIDDIPKKYYIEDDLIGLIEKYEKIKEAFDTNEIELIWKQYLNLWYAKKSIKQLEEVIDKMNSIQIQ